MPTLTSHLIVLYSPYVLLHPDFREVYFDPGTNETFSLSKYKEAISKDYKKLTFYLCLRDEFVLSTNFLTGLLQMKVKRMLDMTINLL